MLYLLFGVLTVAVDDGGNVCAAAFGGGGFTPFIRLGTADDEFGCCIGGGAALVGPGPFFLSIQLKKKHNYFLFLSTLLFSLKLNLYR